MEIDESVNYGIDACGVWCSTGSGIVGRGFGVVIIAWERHAGLFDVSMDHY